MARWRGPDACTIRPHILSLAQARLLRALFGIHKIVGRKQFPNPAEGPVMLLLGQMYLTAGSLVRHQNRDHHLVEQ